MKIFLQRISIVCLLLVPTIGYYLYDGNTVWYQALLFILLRGILLFSFVELIEMLQKRWIKLVVLVLFFPAYFADVLFLYGYKSLMSTSSSLALFNSTYSESLDFITLYALVIGGIVFLYVLVGLFFTKINVQIININNKWIKSSLLVMTAIVCLLIENVYSVSIDGIGRGHYSFVKEKIVKQFPINMYYRTYEYLLYRKKVEEYQKNVINFKFGAMAENNDEPMVVLLMIGETQRSDLYFELVKNHTTDLPSFNSENTLFLPNAFSTSNSTAYSFPLMVTRATADHFHIKNVEPSVVNLFKEAGFKTYWIANQNLFKGPETKSYKAEVDEFYPLWQKGEGDGIVCDKLKNILTQSASKKFIVVNLKGNHYRYEYPVEYEVYTPNLNTENISAIDIKYKQLFLNSYKNNSLYELSVLEQIHSSLDSIQQKVALLFSSDHGESFFETPHKIFGHGSSFVPVDQLRTFAYIWVSEEFRSDNQTIYENIRNNAENIFCSDHIFYSLAEMGKITFKDHKANFSICNRLFIDQDTLKVLNGERVLFLKKEHLN